jgi:hypothetical protein
MGVSAEAAEGKSLMGAAGHLATITTQEEDDFVTSLVSEERAWLGG